MNANKKYKNLTTAILFVAVTLFAFICGTPQTASADMGPKPSVTVTIENLNGRVCYGTLLSYYKYSGPFYAYLPDAPDPYIPSECNPESEYFDENEYAMWQAFIAYDDPDGYYYLQRNWKCHETGKIAWGYYPPQKFKILLYFPETQSYAISDVCERYAFHSYFNAVLTDTDLTVSQTQPISVSQNYDYTWEIVSFLVRSIATVLLEIGVAWLFKMRTKKQIIAVVIVNAVTQIGLNAALNIVSHFHGGLSAGLLYIPLELGIFIAEAIAYSLIFRKKQILDRNTYEIAANPNYVSILKCVLLSFVANLVSFLAGFAMMLFIPNFI